jgi:hypothetical protein
MMRRSTALLVLAVAMAPSISRAAGGDEVFQFSTPSKNIGCVYARFAAQGGTGGFPAELRCDIRSGLRPKPVRPAGCDLDWGDSFAMRKTGAVSVVCHGDTALGGQHVLGYGKTWRHDGFTCVSRRAGLTCTNLSHHGFFLSRQRSRAF